MHRTLLTGVGAQVLGARRCVRRLVTQYGNDAASLQTDLQLESPSRILCGDKQADSGLYMERQRNGVAKPVF